MDTIENNDVQPASPKSGSSWGKWVILLVVVILVGWFFVSQSNKGFEFTDNGVVITRAQSDGDELVLGEINIPEGGGFIAVYEQRADGSRVLYGQSALLSAGKHTNVPVRRSGNSITGKPSPATTYVAVAYQDDGDGVFEESEDEPYVDENGQEISAEIVLESETAEGGEEMMEEDDHSDEMMEDDTSDPSDDDESDTQPLSVTVTYTESGFEPQEITIKEGTKVTWVNEGNGDMWVASAMHPTHTVYPGSDIDKCGTPTEAAIFDQCDNGATYSFTFNEPGEWGFHNHSQANHFGKVKVLADTGVQTQ